MRRLASASCVHQDFVSAVMDLDYAPTGREFVAWSYDRSGASGGGGGRGGRGGGVHDRAFAARWAVY